MSTVPQSVCVSFEASPNWLDPDEQIIELDWNVTSKNAIDAVPVTLMLDAVTLLLKVVIPVNVLFADNKATPAIKDAVFAVPAVVAKLAEIEVNADVADVAVVAELAVLAAMAELAVNAYDELTIPNMPTPEPLNYADTDPENEPVNAP